MLLIDEYNAVSNEYLNMSAQYSDFMRDSFPSKESLMKSLFGWFKSNLSSSSLKRSLKSMVFVGVSPLALNDHTSGFNVEYNITFDSR